MGWRVDNKLLHCVCVCVCVCVIPGANIWNVLQDLVKRKSWLS